MSRFFVPPENIGEKTITIDDRDDLRHMAKVLRLSAGDEIEVSDSVEWEYRAELISIEPDAAEARIIDKQRFISEPSVHVTLFQGIPKQGKMETIVQKCVELGIYDIIPVFTDRTVVVDKGNFSKKVQRWQKVSDEAVKQCRRGIVPQVFEPMKMPELLEAFGVFDLVLFAYESEDTVTIKEVLRRTLETQEWTEGRKRIALISGPEGGFSDEEAEAIVKEGGVSVSLGKTTLRTETAGMAALAMIMYEMEL